MLLFLSDQIHVIGHSLGAHLAGQFISIFLKCYFKRKPSKDSLKLFKLVMQWLKTIQIKIILITLLEQILIYSGHIGRQLSSSGTTLGFGKVKRVTGTKQKPSKINSDLKIKLK
jgi:hypothetical protein